MSELAIKTSGADTASLQTPYPYLTPRPNLPRSPTQTALGGPSRRPKRTTFFGIKRGRVPGVYTSSRLAEDQVIDYPDACLRCFSTRYAATAYVGGWDCKGKYALPKGSPYPLFEHLLFNYSTPLHLLCPLPKRRTAHHPPRPLVVMDEFGAFAPSSNAHPSLATSSDTLTLRCQSTLRPPIPGRRDSWRTSMVKSPSPLRHQVDEVEVSTWTERAPGLLGLGVMMVSPLSPGKGDGKGGDGEAGTGKEKGKRSSIFGFSTFTRKNSAPAGKLLASPEITTSTDLAPPLPRQPLRSSRSSPNLPRGPYQSSIQRPQSRLNPNPNPHPHPSPRANPYRQSGLWSSPSSPLAEDGPYNPSQNSHQASPSPKSAPAFANTEAPAFSRAAMRKSGIIMPTSASSVTRRSPSVPSLSPSSSSSSISSLSSISSGSSNGIGSRGSGTVLDASSDFAPPRAGFMRRPSSLSLSSSPASSSDSVATITSASYGESDAECHNEGGYSATELGLGSGKGTKVEGKKEKKDGMMKGFGRMFGMKKKA